MAGRLANAARVDVGTNELLMGGGAFSVVAFLCETEGLSRWQTQRIVGRAYWLIIQDLEEAAVDPRQLTVQLIATLQDASASALE